MRPDNGEAIVAAASSDPGLSDVAAASSGGEASITPRRRVRGSRVLVVLVAMLLAAVVVVVGVAAAAPPAPYRQTVYIDIYHSHYDPTLVSVPAGVPVRFVIRNLDPIDHEWIVGDAAVHALHRTDTEMHHGARATEVSIAALRTVETVITFPARGTLQFICHLPGHEEYGMIGSLDIR